MHTDEPVRFGRALDALSGGWRISPAAADATSQDTPVVLGRIG
jgi:hypothetical protein